MPEKTLAYLMAGLAIFSLIAPPISDGLPAVSAPTPAVVVSSPNGGEGWASGTQQTITWRYEGIAAEAMSRWSFSKEAGAIRLSLRMRLEAPAPAVLIAGKCPFF